MSITTKITRKQWVRLAFFIDSDGSSKIRSSREMKEYIKERYKGVYNQSVGFGCITFECEEQLTWFLLRFSS